jgi:RNA polymerase sigma factor (sigma-70 family)
MRKKYKTLMHYREREVIGSLGLLPLSGDFTPTYFVEEESSYETINPEEIEELTEYFGPEEIFEENQLKNTMKYLLDSLTPRESKILQFRFGINTITEFSLEQVASMFSVTRERIRQLEAKALRKMRHPSRSSLLYEFLGVYISITEKAKELPPERNTEFGWNENDEIKHNEEIVCWEKRITSANKILKDAKIKLLEGSI